MEGESPLQEGVAVKVTVYLNESRDMFSPFDFKTARLRQAIEFDLDAALPSALPPKGEPLSVESLQAARQAHEDAALKLLEEIFTQLNVGGDIYPAEDYTKDYREAGNRSLSVGDVVVLGGSLPYAVGRFGWDRIANAAVTLSAKRFDRLGSEVVW